MSACGARRARRSFLISTCLVFLVSAGAVLWWRRDQGSPEINAKFAGWTNDASGQKLTRFEIRNRGATTVKLHEAYPKGEPHSVIYSNLLRFEHRGTLLRTGAMQIVHVTPSWISPPYCITFGATRHGMRDRFKIWVSEGKNPVARALRSEHAQYTPWLFCSSDEVPAANGP